MGFRADVMDGHSAIVVVIVAKEGRSVTVLNIVNEVTAESVFLGQVVVHAKDVIVLVVECLQERRGIVGAAGRILVRGGVHNNRCFRVDSNALSQHVGLLSEGIDQDAALRGRRGGAASNTTAGNGGGSTDQFVDVARADCVGRHVCKLGLKATEQFSTFIIE